MSSNHKPTKRPSLLLEEDDAPAKNPRTSSALNPWYSNLREGIYLRAMPLAGLAVVTAFASAIYLLPDAYRSPDPDLALTSATQSAIYSEPAIRAKRPPIAEAPSAGSQSRVPTEAAVIVQQPPLTEPAVYYARPAVIRGESSHATPAAPPAKAPKLAQPRPITKPKAAEDIDVLVALIHFAEDEEGGNVDRKMLQSRLRACPAANTDAGITCRQLICSDLNDHQTLCPEGS